LICRLQWHTILAIVKLQCQAGGTMVGLPINTIHQGDCVEMLRRLAPGSVHLAFADPPFNIGYKYDVYDDRRRADEYLDWSRDWITGVHRALRPSGTFWLAIGDEFAAELKLIAQRDIGFSCRTWVIWYYTFGVNCRRGFSRSHTHLFHFVKDPRDFTFNESNPAARVPSARQLVYADLRANPRGRLPDNTWILRPQDAPRSFAPDHDTWYFPRVAGTFKEREGFHGCQMPEQLLGRIIRLCSNPMDVVLDPFGGSGTTLAVAKKLGRQWIGIELSAEYVDRVRTRLEQAQVGAPLDGAEDPRKSAPTTKRGKQQKKLVASLPTFKNNRPTIPAGERAELTRAVIQAYQFLPGGYSADYVLADPELNASFIAECERQQVPGDPVIWNQMLLRVRKQGKLPRIAKRRSGRTADEADDYAFASEVALHRLSVDFDTTLDGVLCDPALAQRFDDIAALFDPGQHSPLEYRWAALSLRKRAKWAKRLATRFESWRSQELPPPVPLAKWNADKAAEYAVSGVYALLTRQRHCLFIGTTVDVGRQIQQILQTASWKELEPTAAHIVQAKKAGILGLKAVLIQRLHPLMNSQLLFPQTATETTDDLVTDPQMLLG